MYKSDNPIGFMHVPKTAGGTISTVVSNLYSNEQTFRIVNDPSYSYHIEKLTKKKYDEDIVKIFFGHFSFQVVKHFPKNIRMFSMMRDPRKRVISYYMWAKTNKKHFLYDEINSNNYSILDCLENKLSVELDNGQVRLFSGLDMHEDIKGDGWCNVKFGHCNNEMLSTAKLNIDRTFEFIGIQEYFYVTLWLFGKKLGWVIPNFGSRNISNNGEDIDKESLAAINEYNTFDNKLYDYVLTKFINEANKIDGIGGLQNVEELAELNLECKNKIESSTNGTGRGDSLIRMAGKLFQKIFIRKQS